MPICKNVQKYFLQIYVMFLKALYLKKIHILHLKVYSFNYSVLAGLYYSFRFKIKQISTSYLIIAHQMVSISNISSRSDMIKNNCLKIKTPVSFETTFSVRVGIAIQHQIFDTMINISVNK